MRFGLGARILGAMLIVSLLPLAGLGWNLRQRLTAELSAAAENRMSLQIDAAEYQISDYIQQYVPVMKSAAALPQVTSMDPAQQVPALKAVNSATPDLAGIIATNPSGMNVARTDGNQLTSVGERPYFQEAMSGKDVAFQTVLSKVSGKPTLIIAVPIKRDNKVVGVLYTNLQLDRVSTFVNDIKLGQTGFVWLTDNDSKLMAYPDAEKVKKQESTAEHPAIQQARAGKEGLAEWQENGKTWLGVKRVLPQGWVLVLQMERGEALSAVDNVDRTFMTVGGIALLTVILLGLLLTWSLTAPVQAMARFVHDLAEGDFTGTLSVRRSDELGRMADALRQMQAAMREHVASVGAAIAAVTATSRELAAASDTAFRSQEAIGSAFAQTLSTVETATDRQKEQLDAAKAAVSELVGAIEGIAGSASHQASEVNRATQVVQDVLERAQHVSQRIALINAATEQAAAAAATGDETVKGALEGIQATQESVEHAAETVQELGERSQAISHILDEISAIADQTNLLALNAAIEAARAGEAGRGFAVVADEVRKLADRSVRSAREINTILEAVRTSVDDAVAVMGRGSSAAQRSSHQAAEAQRALAEILQAVNASADEARTVGAAAAGMEEGHRQLTSATENLAAVAEENAASAEEMAAGSETVRSAVAELDTLAMQNFTSITGTGRELGNISEAVHRMSDAVRRLEGVSQALEASAARLKV